MRIPGPPGQPPKHPGRGWPLPRNATLPHTGAPTPRPHRSIFRPGAVEALASQLVLPATRHGRPAPGAGPFQLGRLAATGDADMKPALGSVLHYTPDDRGWLAQLADDRGNTWPEPVIGWAVVVSWTGYESDDPTERREQPDQFQTALEPVMFDGTDARTRSDLAEGVTLVRLHMPGYGGLLAPPPAEGAPADT